MSAHAILSPSSASRWINCPPSAKLNAEAGDRDTVFTREGTLAHAVAELKARKHFLTGVGPKKFQAAMDKFRANELWQDEMDGHTDTYLDALKDIAATFTDTPYVALEQRVDFSEYVPEGFGTADCIMMGRLAPSTESGGEFRAGSADDHGAQSGDAGRYDGDVLHIVDFKYGKGVDVSAEDNPQMKLYALGAILQYMAFYDIFTVRMTIVQPRIKREPDTWEMPARDLLHWAEDVVKPAAKLAAAGEGEFAEGDWCRWCAIRGSCRARAGANTALEDFGFKQPPTLTDAEVGRALELGQRLKSWLSDLEDYALTACLNGAEVTGWKAVEGRSVRAWTDPVTPYEVARDHGVPEAMLYERKPVSLAALEKIMGKKAFLETLSQYVFTPPGKPTLVRADDKRPAITNKPEPEDDFGEELPF